MAVPQEAKAELEKEAFLMQSFQECEIPQGKIRLLEFYRKKDGKTIRGMLLIFPV
ncbi:hypothetical protein QUG02_28410 [Bacillus hominis]|uniref:CYTH domain-containing protein n=1 Tax=Bacillus hominis TaxID=2817478 RepID=A0ABT7RG37_9BACI|nr:hypothetical protein [Bacillus hominis]MDM5191499.1 hypothetical protein [Bacillus hominis]MDM5441925.1 hypothetical protein [Bacillus hominis]